MANKHQIVITLLLLGLFSWTAWKAIEFRQLARFFPLYVSLFAISLSLIQLVIEIKLGKTKDPLELENIGIDPLFIKSLPDSIKYFVWFFGFFLLIYLIGFQTATIIFLFLFFLIEAKLKLFQIIIRVVSATFIIHVFGSVMNLYWPRSLFNLWF